MDFSDKLASVSAGFFLFGLSLAGFALFLHPMDPTDFLVKVVFSPQETFPIVSRYMQGVGFWFSAACLAIGIAGLAAIALRRWQRRQCLSKLDATQLDGGDGEENWMFL